MSQLARVSACLTLTLTALGAAACSSDAGEESSGIGGSANGRGGSSSTGNGGTGSQPIVTGGTGGSSGASGTTSGASGGGNGSPEVCDGVDNDGNGVIDDVDAGGDGVCDCLNIATIGTIGPWSNGGNIFESWLNARTPRGSVALGDQELTAQRLDGLQVIVVLHVATTAVSNMGRTSPAQHEFSDAEAEAFGNWIRAGGGVMTTIGYTSNEAEEVVNVNRLLASVGMGYSASQLNLTSYVQDWREHPVTMGVTNIFTDNGVEPDGAGTTVAFGNGERAALEVIQAENGRVVVWGDEWITYDSEWEDVDDQQVELFWLNILKWLSPPRTCQVPIPPDIVR